MYLGEFWRSRGLAGAIVAGALTIGVPAGGSVGAGGSGGSGGVGGSVGVGGVADSVGLTSTAVHPGALQTPTPACPTPAIALSNGSFEQPAVNATTSLPQAQIPGWQTSAPDGRIELWPSQAGGFPAVDGNQWVEVNGNTLDTLYQDVATVPGAIVDYVVFHRSRTGTNTAQIQFGPPGSPANYTQNMTDDTTGWGYYVGRYQIPPGQTTTRFAFAAISGSGPNESIGNFLDAVHFGAPGCGQTQVSAIDLNGSTLRPGDQVEYTLTAANVGGVPVGAPVLSGPIPPGTSYVPGSMVLLDDGVSTPLSDADDEDPGRLAADGVVVDVGGALRDWLLSGHERQLTYRVQVEAAPGVDSIDLQADLEYGDVVGDDRSVAYSNIVRLPLDLPAPPSPPPSTPAPQSAPAMPPATSPTGQALVERRPSLPDSGTSSLGLAVLGGLAILAGVALLARRQRSVRRAVGHVGR